ncbi:MAG TPA: hypothetical protein VNO22_06720 [Planctomycetota bacterium]|jgi:ABC-type transport system involved in multi-copper enzyme maturation permease subunit|nr:hypothetical protein [Planctomycetota bacterium]
MPIYDLGYRPWTGRLTPAWSRWWAISRSGIGLAFRSKILRRCLFLAIAPLLYFGPLFFAIGSLTDPDSGWGNMVRRFLGGGLTERLVEDPASVRPQVWSAIFAYYFMYFQSSLTFLVLAIVGPPLISQDVRSKAFLLYFSKPITRMEYLLGKGGTALFYVLLVTLVPGLVLYVLSVAFSPSLSVVADTAATIPRILAASAVLAVPATLVVLALSSLTDNPRFATFGWIALCLLGPVFVFTLEHVPELRGSSWLFFLSLHEAAFVVVGALFDVEGIVRLAKELHAPDLYEVLDLLHSPYSPATAAVYLAGVCGLAVAVVYRRISAPLRV